MRSILAAQGCLVLLVLAFWATVIYAIVHFLLKFW